MWAAKLALESDPKWLRHFHLFDGDKRQARRLRELKRQAEAKRGREKRDINVYEGDFNTRVRGILRDDLIGPKEAVFCLLDQRTFECKWSTVKLLAEFKRKPNNKIELFYFLERISNINDFDSGERLRPDFKALCPFGRPA